MAQSEERRPFSSFRLLSFDIYGTLIDWEAGIFDALEPLRTRLPESHALKSDRLGLGNLFNKHEKQIQAANPTLTYDGVLRDAYIALGQELNVLPASSSSAAAAATDLDLNAEGTAFAASIARWPPFPDTVAAMRKLKRMGYKLVPLSNVDWTSFSKTLSGPLAGLKEPFSEEEEEEEVASSSATPGVPLDPFFDAVYTAQDIGSYKPDLRNFEYLIEHVRQDFGVDKHEILHVAQSLFHDHEPAKKTGLTSVWIARGEKDGESGMGGKVDEFLNSGRVGFAWKFRSLGEFADAVEKERLSS